MNITVLYDSEFGNTGTLAEAIADELRTDGEVQVINVRVDPVTPSPAVDLLVVGGPTQVHGVTVPLRTFLDALPPTLVAGVAAATFDTRAHGPQFLTGAASKGIAKRLARRGAHLVKPAGSFLVDGKEGPLAEGELERARAWARTVLVASAPTGASPRRDPPTPSGSSTNHPTERGASRSQSAQ